MKKGKTELALPFEGPYSSGLCRVNSPTPSELIQYHISGRFHPFDNGFAHKPIEGNAHSIKVSLCGFLGLL